MECWLRSESRMGASSKAGYNDKIFDHSLEEGCSSRQCVDLRSESICE